MQRMIAVVALLLLAACASAPQGSNWTSCNRDEQRGCIQLDVVHAQNSNNSLVRGLVEGSRNATETGFGKEFYRSVKDGKISLDSRCVPVTINVWGINPNIPATAVMTRHYTMRGGLAVEISSETARQTKPSQLLADKKQPDAAFILEICGGLGSIQFPWEYLTSGAMILLCPPEEATIYPDRMSGKTEGLWVYPDEVEKWRRERRDYTVVPIISPRR